MATLNSQFPSLTDVIKLINPNGMAAKVVNVLDQLNEIVDDMVAVECNNGDGHVVTVENTLPAVAYRMLNGGTTPTFGTHAQFTEATAMLEQRSLVDVKVAGYRKDPENYRFVQSRMVLEAMIQQTVSTIFYGNALTDPTSFTGLSPRYSSLSGDTSANIINGGGAAGSQFSIWLINWSDMGLQWLYPDNLEGGTAGIKHTNLNTFELQNAAGVTNAMMTVHGDKYEWDGGICLNNYKNVVRICNLDLTDLQDETNEPNIPQLMNDAYHCLKDRSMGRISWYMNRTARKYFERQCKQNVAAGGQLSYDVVDGKRMTSYMGIPVKTVDQLTIAESVIS